MAKFCVYCGRPLKEGEVCTCRNQSQQAAPSTTGQAVAVPSASASKASVYLKALWDLIKKSFKAPAQMLGSFASSADSKMALGLIGVQAISFGLFMDVFCSRITSVALNLLNKIASALGESDTNEESIQQVAGLVKFPLGKIFFLSLALSVLEALIFAAILLLFVNIFKGKTTYKHMLCVSGANSLAAFPFMLLGIVGMWINFRFGLGLAVLSLILQPYFTYEALNGVETVDRNKSIYVCFLSFAAMTIIVSFIAKQVYPMYLPDELKSVVNELSSQTESASYFLNQLFQ